MLFNVLQKRLFKRCQKFKTSLLVGLLVYSPYESLKNSRISMFVEMALAVFLEQMLISRCSPTFVVSIFFSPVFISHNTPQIRMAQLLWILLIGSRILSCTLVVCTNRAHKNQDFFIIYNYCAVLIEVEFHTIFNQYNFPPLQSINHNPYLKNVYIILS